MKEYGKRVQIDPVEFWAMVDAGKTRTEIAKRYGVSVQTVCNRITKGRPSVVGAPIPQSASPTAPFTQGSLNEGGETVGTGVPDGPSARDEKFEEIINGVDAGKKKENKDMDTSERIMDTFLGSGRPEAENSNNENDTYDNGTHACDNGIGTCDTEDCAPVDAASSYAAMFAETAASIIKSAEFAGMTIECTNITVKSGYTTAEVTGTRKDGKYCELRLTVMDAPPAYISVL